MLSLVAAREDDPDHEHDGAGGEDAPERDPSPGRHLRDGEHPDDERKRRKDLEQPVRDDASEERSPEAAPRRHAADEHPDACHLADPAREDAVREDPDEERREEVEQPGMRARDGLDHDRAPGQGSRDRGEEVEPDCQGGPAPLHRGERVADGSPVGAACPEQRDDTGRRSQDENRPQPPEVCHGTV